LPQAMYKLAGVTPVLMDGNNAILHKTLDNDIVNAEKIIISHSIVYVVSGIVKVSAYDCAEVTVSSGEMLFMPRDSYLISDYMQDDKRMEVYIFFFDHTVALEFLQHSSKSAPEARADQKHLLKLTPSDNVHNYINALNGVGYQNNRNRHLLFAKLFELLHLISETDASFADALLQVEMNSTDRDIAAYMREHYAKNLSISDWASLQGTSVSTFNRDFKKKHGISPKKWILRQNMMMAYDMLKAKKAVSECAMEFGYHNTSNFIKAYKEIHKVTPKQHIKASS
jgi:AraC-like DNA-binding protein